MNKLKKLAIVAGTFTCYFGVGRKGTEPIKNICPKANSTLCVVPGVGGKELPSDTQAHQLPAVPEIMILL